MIKKCVVCGKEFEAANYRYCICSDKCRKVREKQYHSGTVYKYIYKPVDVFCKICGADVCFFGAEYEPLASRAWNRRADNGKENT